MNTNLNNQIKILRKNGDTYQVIVNKLNICIGSVQYNLNPVYRDRSRATAKKWHINNKNNIRVRVMRSIASIKSRSKKKNYMPCIASHKELIDGFTGLCHICNTPEIECNKRLCLDHDHQTGKFRGWICHDCNWTLGKVKDSISILENLIKYLQK